LALSIGVALALAACGGNAAPSASSSEASSAAEPAASSTASTADETPSGDASDMELPAAFVTINRDDAELHVGLVTAEKDGAFLSLIVQCPTEAGVDEVISGLKAIIA